MKPIYFPFTYVSDPVAEALAACFGQFIIYRPAGESLSDRMQSLLSRGVMDVRVPVTENENELKAALNNYRTWADLHRGGAREKITALKAQMESMPFFSDFSSSKIAGDIKEKSHGQPNSRIPDPALAARIFLYFAQEFDRQNHELALDLQRCGEQEADLIRQLKMEDEPVAGEFHIAPLQSSDSFADYMISDRLEAWTRIFCRDPEAPGLFVTHSPAILEYLLERASTAARVMNFDSIPLGQEKRDARESWQQKMALNLVRLAEGKPDESSGESIEQLDWPPARHTVSLSVYRVPDQTPREFFTQCAGINRTADNSAGGENKIKNTLIAVVQG
jgi:hypothetical protein